MEIIVAIIGVVALIAGIVIYSSLSWGYVVLKMWGWFILPVFTQLPQLTYWQAVGITFFIGLFHEQIGIGSYIKDDWEYKDRNTPIASAIVAPWTTLLTVYIIKSMFM